MKHFLSIDATAIDRRAGCLKNDPGKPKCIMKKGTHDYLPKLWLYPLKDLEVGIELHYDYRVPALPWRQKVQYVPYYYMAKKLIK